MANSPIDAGVALDGAVLYATYTAAGATATSRVGNFVNAGFTAQVLLLFRFQSQVWLQRFWLVLLLFSSWSSGDAIASAVSRDAYSECCMNVGNAYYPSIWLTTSVILVSLRGK